jgi:hypothetical protein
MPTKETEVRMESEKKRGEEERRGAHSRREEMRAAHSLKKRVEALIHSFRHLPLFRLYYTFKALSRRC